MLREHRTVDGRSIKICMLKDEHLVACLRFPLKGYIVNAEEDAMFIPKGKILDDKAKSDYIDSYIHYIAEGLRRNATRTETMRILGVMNNKLSNTSRVEVSGFDPYEHRNEQKSIPAKYKPTGNIEDNFDEDEIEEIEDDYDSYYDPNDI